MEEVMIKLMDSYDWSLYAIIIASYNPKISKYDEFISEIQDTIDDVKERYPGDYTYDDICDVLRSKYDCEIYEMDILSYVEY